MAAAIAVPAASVVAGSQETAGAGTSDGGGGGDDDDDDDDGAVLSPALAFADRSGTSAADLDDDRLCSLLCFRLMVCASE